MKKYVHNPIEVEAVQVVKPFRAFTLAFPRHHSVKLPSGRISYFHVVDAQGRSKAYPGDWVVRFEDKSVQILTDAEFNRKYQELGMGIVEQVQAAVTEALVARLKELEDRISALENK